MYLFQKLLTFTHSWISIKLMRYFWPLHLAHNSLNVYATDSTVNEFVTQVVTCVYLFS